MARRPSQRASRDHEAEDLNLTPIMDMITTIMFFLLIFANIIPVVIIDAPLPKIAETADEIRQAKQTDNKLDVTIRINPDGFQVVSSLGGSAQIAKNGKEFDFQRLHQVLIAIHQKNPKTREITLIPTDTIDYDTIIRTMDAAREYYKEDPGYQPVPPEIAQKPESLRFNRLFPDVNLGGV